MKAKRKYVVEKGNNKLKVVETKTWINNVISIMLVITNCVVCPIVAWQEMWQFMAYRQ